MLAVALAACGLHAVFPARVGSEIAKAMPREALYTDALTTLLEQEENRCLLQQSPERGLTVYALVKKRGAWCVVGQIPGPKNHADRWRARTEAVLWLQRQSRQN